MAKCFPSNAPQQRGMFHLEAKRSATSFHPWIHEAGEQCHTVSFYDGLIHFRDEVANAVEGNSEAILEDL